MSSEQKPNSDLTAPIKKLTKLPEDLARMLQKMRKFERRVKNRCDALDALCSDFLNSPEFNLENLKFSCIDNNSTDEEISESFLESCELLNSSIFNDNVEFTSTVENIDSDLEIIESLCSDFLNLPVNYGDAEVSTMEDVVVISKCDLLEEESLRFERNFWKKIRAMLLKFNARGRKIFMALLMPKVVSGSAGNIIN